jgi:hypothetical protein
VGEGDTELRSRCCAYFRRPDGEERSASWGDLGGQFWVASRRTIEVIICACIEERDVCVPPALGLSRTIIVEVVLLEKQKLRTCPREEAPGLSVAILANWLVEGRIMGVYGLARGVYVDREVLMPQK